MTREAIGAALLLLGAVVARLTITGEHLAFVKQSLSIPLLLSAAVLLALGALELRESVRAARAEEHDPDDHDGHDHDEHPAPQVAVPLSDAVDNEVGEHLGHHHVGAGPRMGALLLAPLGVLMLVPAAPLGAFAADNGAANRVADLAVYGELPAATDGAVDIVVPEVVGRAVLEPATIEGTPLRTVGFAVPSEDQPGSYLLSRFTVGCCAVDAAPFQLLVETQGAPVPEREQWVEAVVRFTGEVVEDGEEQIPVFELVEQELIEEPDVPYVY